MKQLFTTSLLTILIFTANSQNKFYKNTYLAKNTKGIQQIDEIHLFQGSTSFFTITIFPSSPPKPGDSTINSKAFYEFDTKQIKTFLLSNDSLIEKSTLRKIINDLDDYYNPTTVTITGNGLSNFTSSSPKAFTTGATAGFGLNVSNPNGIELGIIGTVSETDDTILSQNKRDFGTSILVPGIRKFSLMINYRNRKFFNDRWGCGTFLNLTPLDWGTYTAKSQNSNTFDSVPIYNTIVPLTFELYASYTWFTNVYKEPKPDNPVCITLDMGFTIKSIGGDQMDRETRQQYLGSPQTFFPGLLLGLDLRFAGSHAYFYSTFIPPLGKNSANINGLTGFQVVGGIGLAANIAKL